MNSTRNGEAGTRNRAANRKLRSEQVSAGPLTITIGLDEAGRLHAVTLPSKIPAGLTAAQLAGILAKLERFALATDSAPPFHRKVWTRLRTIRPGRTLTYGRVAAALGSPRASRAVGQACAANRLALVIPCHRVVGITGPGGFAWGLAWKAKLLELESTHAPKV